jgi:colanic acid biosynthesis glycosyl transferase WcaI
MKAKFWVHVQDFEFDLALDSGVVKHSNFFFKFFKKTLSFFESKMLNSADIVSSISNSMLKKVKEKSHHTNPFYFPNWVSSDKINPSISSKHKIVSPNMFTVLYSGNIGEKQNWLFLENLCELVKETDAIEIIIVGDGAYKNNLKKQLEKFNFVKFFDPVPYEELNDLLCSVDVHFLFQKNEVIDTVMPSKLLAMMASAKPSIISGNKESEVAFIINESKGGYYFSDDNVLSVYNQIIDLKKSPEMGLEIGNKARSYVLNRFSSNKVLNDFNDKLLSVLNG